MNASQADELDLELRAFYQRQHRRGLRRHAVEAPCIRVHGPKLRFLVGPVRMLGV